MDDQRHPSLGDRTSVRSYFAVAGALLVIVFAWLEPAGASQLGFFRGVLFWSLQMAMLLPLLILLQKLASAVAQGLNPWVTTAIVGVFASLLFAPLAYLLDMLFAIPEIPPSPSFISGVLDELGGVAPPVTIVWLGLNAPWIMGLNFHSISPPGLRKSEEPSTAEITKPFLELVSKEIGGDILSVSSELHYVRVRTTKGSGMLLYNLRDAIREMARLPGTQIHRSHWVAQKHVVRIMRDDGQRVCVLTDGTKLPISRRRQQAVLEYFNQSERFEHADGGAALNA